MSAEIKTAMEHAKKIVAEFEDIFGRLSATERDWLTRTISEFPRADAEPTTQGDPMGSGRQRPNSGFDSRDGGHPVTAVQRN